MEGFRKNTAETLRKTPKDDRREKLAEVRRTDEYWTERVKKLVSQGQKAEWTPDRTGLHWKVKNLYHGTDVENISDFNYAEESTIGDNAVYFTTDAPLAMGYAKLRNRERKSNRTFLYEAVVSDVNIMNWAETPVVEKLKNEYADYCGDLRQKIQQLGFEEFSKKYELPPTITQSMAQLGLKRIIETCEDEGALHGGNIKTVAQGVMGMFFERFVKSKGYDGVITVEGGDDPELTAKAGISVVIFNKAKIVSHRAVDVSPATEATTAKLENEKIKKLFGHCFEIAKFDEGDNIPVGGESIFSSEANITVKGDFENFKQFLTETHELAGKYELAKLKEWLTSQGIEIGEKLFATLFAFTKKFEEQYPDNPERSEARRKLYNEKGNAMKLSDIFGANSAECAEIAALAQVYLQQEGVPSTYFSGDALWNRDDEFSEEHSFIVIRQGDKVYLYDPTNPVNTTAGKFPSIYTTEAKFDEEMSKPQKRFVTAKNLVSKKEAFFGTNNGTNVWAEKDVV